MSLPEETPGRDQDGVYNGKFVKTVSEDTIEYSIYVVDDVIKTDLDLRTQLQEIELFSKSLVKHLLKDHIWQKESFALLLQQNNVSGQKDSILPLKWFLQGRTTFGDSISDEWLVVYILKEISLKFKHVWVRVTDNDGEFLLVEAAKSLPSWLEPEIAENRVWINQGDLRIISSDQKMNLDLVTAIKILQSSRNDLLHSQAIQESAFSRLRNYPKAIEESLHSTLVRIPRRLAFVLHQKPSYISPAVEVFFLRDPISLRPLATKDIATLNFPPEDFVTTSIKFTRVGFAQLKSQEFPPPPSWTAIIPHLKDPKVDIGSKVACGFEMLLQDKQHQDDVFVREIKLILGDIDTGEEQLPTDKDMESWSMKQDDEGWLIVSFEDLDRELSNQPGTTKEMPTSDISDDTSAEPNLKKMVSQFESFLADDKAGIDGAQHDGIDLNDNDDDDDDDGTTESESDSEGEDIDGSYDEAEFEQAMREMMGLPPEEKEKRGLVDEARRLALEMEDEEEANRDDEEDAKKVMEMMERELKGHGALDLNDLKRRAESREQQGLIYGKGKGPQPFQKNHDDDEVEELSSDDDNEENDVNVDLLRNLLESLKNEGGMSGPASNMLASMGIRLPRDDDNVKRSKS